MAASPVNFLFCFLVICITLWLLFMLLAWILSRVVGASIRFRFGGWKCIRDLVVEFKKGAVESVSVGEIKLSLRQSLVKLFGFISKDPKLQVLICDLEVVMRPSSRSTAKAKPRRPRTTKANSGRGKWMVVANIARYLSVSITDLVLKMPKASIEVKELKVDMSKDGASKQNLIVKLQISPIVVLRSDPRVSCDLSNFSTGGSISASQSSSSMMERTSALFICEDFILSCEFGYDRYYLWRNMFLSVDKEWIFVPAQGSSGGIAVIWNTKHISVTESLVGVFSASIKIKAPNGMEWWLSGVYGPCKNRERREFLEELAGLYGMCGTRWCIGGDFNVVRFINEKSNGGRLTKSMRNFNDFIRETELKDLDLLNAQFTWSNLREEPVCRRLDRFLCSTGCEDIFPEARQTALARVISDHCPIQLDTNKVKWGPCPFRFENMWLQDPEFRNKFKEWWQSEQVEGWEGYKFMIKLKAMKKKVQSWSKESFGEIEKVLKEAEANIEELDKREGTEGLDFEARSKREELQNLVGDLAFKEEAKWRQRSKVEWAKEGDGNTRFFHRVANGRRKRNFIERLEPIGGGLIEDAKEIEEHIVNFFKSLFSSNDEACCGLEGINWAPISALEAIWLERPFEEAEVQRAVFDCGKDKSPGPDGFSMQMFQHCWDILKEDIMKIMEEFFEKGIINAVTNETFICLIPKKSDSLKVTDYRPISLVTGLYKIIAKTLASRLKEVLVTTVSPHQGAFVKDRQILDAVLIANEVVEEIRQKKEKGLVLKIDFEKAYDHVEWRFLEEVLQRKGFGNRWRKWIQGCLCSANFSVLINGRPRGKFQASRGLRQGDPLSPFLFTLVVDVLSRLMEKAQENDLIKGLCIGQEKVEISHLQFADDTIFFFTEDEEVWNNLLQVLNLFCSVSGLKINKAKCFLAGINSESEKLNRMADSWGCEVGCWPIKYLGLHLGGRPKAIRFWDPVVETMERRLQSWKKAFLSRGGRLTLIQSVLGSLPIYYMSLFKIPCGVRRHLEKLMKGFLWEGVEEGKKTHLVKWELVTKNKEEGGLGVGNLRNQNEALLAKWLWRFPRESHSLWHKVIRSKYGLQVNGWNVLPPRRVSSRSPWKDISSGAHQFLSCCKFEVGNGERVRFWEDGWLVGGPLKEQFPRLFLLSRKHNHNISSFVEASSSSLSWNFDFRRNLNEMEIEEAASLLQKVEVVRLSPSKMDNRRWNLETSGLFTCKSYRSLLSNNGIVHYYPPYSQIWKSKVPPKVKILVWLVANGSLNTCDKIQRRNPMMCLSPHWCSLCKAKEESVNHIFLHCSYSIQLWWKLFQEVKVSWVIPKGCFELLSTNFKALGKGKKSKALWGCLVSAIFWNIWLERNKRIFEDYSGVGAEVLWGRVKYWASFWASVTKEFNNCSLSQILWDLLAAVK